MMDGLRGKAYPKGQMMSNYIITTLPPMEKESSNVRGRHRLPIPTGVQLERRRVLCTITLGRTSFRVSLPRDTFLS